MSDTRSWRLPPISPRTRRSWFAVGAREKAGDAAARRDHSAPLYPPRLLRRAGTHEIREVG